MLIEYIGDIALDQACLADHRLSHANYFVVLLLLGGVPGVGIDTAATHLSCFSGAASTRACITAPDLCEVRQGASSSSLLLTDGLLLLRCRRPWIVLHLI